MSAGVAFATFGDGFSRLLLCRLLELYGLCFSVALHHVATYATSLRDLIFFNPSPQGGSVNAEVFCNLLAIAAEAFDELL